MIRSAIREKAKKATLGDVARHAGVSPMTVSRVINHQSNVRSDTKERVLKTIEKLNYTPNVSARTLAGNRARRFALLYFNPSTFYLSELLVGALEETSRDGHQLLVHKIDENDLAENARAIFHSLAEQYDGLIVPPPLSDSDVVRATLRRLRAPAVFLSGEGDQAGAATIRIDDYQAAFDLTQYLIGLGHRRIGFIKGDPNQAATVERLRGFQDAMAGAGLTVNRNHLAAGRFTYKSGLAAAEKLLTANPAPTAIFASNDDMAAAVMAVAAAKDLTVPARLSIAGFDDSPIADAVHPRLTTVKQPLGDMAAGAVRALAQLAAAAPAMKPVAPEVIVMKHEIVRGKSTSRPAQCVDDVR